MARRASRRGGASAPQHCKTTLRSCLKSGPALSGTVARACFKGFNKCRSKKRSGGGKKRGRGKR
jgi:hypothetical protein